MNIYLDIDGVLLANEFHPAKHAHEFLEHLTAHYTVFWLTTHCRGDAAATVEHLRPVLPPKTLELAKKIRATNWTVNKTEAIDFTQPFLWFDDDLFPEERADLEHYDSLRLFIRVDLLKNEDELISLKQITISKQLSKP